MFADVRLPTGLVDLLKATWREIDEDNVFGLAAQLAFYFFLGLFPALLFLVALVSYLPIEQRLDDLIALFAEVVPREVLTILERQLTAIAANERGGLLTLGIIGALWSSSAAMVAIITTLNHAYDITDFRPWWKRRLLAVGLTVGLAAFILVAFLIIVTGPLVIDWVAAWLGFGDVFRLVWTLARWPLAFFLAVVAIDLIYYFAPNAEARWAWVTPGSLVATGMWILGSAGFRFYVGNFANYNATYGTIGGVIVLMLWFYLTALAILVGAELNAEIDKISPHRVAKPSRPDERPAIGAAAEKRHEEG